MSDTSKDPQSKDASSLVSPEAYGGIPAASGFDFQTRYAACHLPIWLLQGNFEQLLFEGTGDIDVRLSGAPASRIHIQVKDHDVTPAEFKEVVEQFQKVDAGMPGIYQRFTVACPSLSAALRSVESALARLRGAQPFYDDVPEALQATRQDLTARLDRAGLAQYETFIQSKVFIEVGHGDLRHDERALELFIARLLDHPEYARRLRSMVQPAFAEVMRLIAARRGVVLNRKELEEVLQRTVLPEAGAAPGITVWVQNWTREEFDRSADYELDWSDHFDRDTRRVPSTEVWDKELVPALRDLRKKIAGERPERLIRFRGKCTLSTGVAVGSAFPAVGGWTFEVPQPPSLTAWRSDAVPTAGYETRTEVVDAASGSPELVLALTIKGDGRADVTRYIEAWNSPPRFRAFVSPVAQGGQAIGGGEDACAFVQAVRHLLNDLTKTHSLRRTHLFVYGPLALSIFLGQQLTAVGEVQLYEFQDPGYVPSCSIRT
jgi:hypothetical protein